MDDFLDRVGLLKKLADHENPHLISWRERDY